MKPGDLVTASRKPTRQKTVLSEHPGRRDEAGAINPSTGQLDVDNVGLVIATFKATKDEDDEALIIGVGGLGWGYQQFMVML